MSSESLYPNKPFRDAFQRQERSEGITYADIAYRAGWVTPDARQKPDSSRVARQLGLVPEHGEYRTEVSEENAIALCKALHLDYTDVGI
jgi:hypothetical protein